MSVSVYIWGGANGGMRSEVEKLPPTNLSLQFWEYGPPEAPKLYGASELLITDLAGNMSEILVFSLAIELHGTPRY